jgi:hypothetical protein
MELTQLICTAVEIIRNYCAEGEKDGAGKAVLSYVKKLFAQNKDAKSVLSGFLKDSSNDSLRDDLKIYLRWALKNKPNAKEELEEIIENE